MAGEQESKVNPKTFFFFFFKIHCWVYKTPLNSYQLRFLSNGTSQGAKMGMPSEDFDGTLFKNVSCNFKRFLTGTLVYHLPCKG